MPLSRLVGISAFGLALLFFAAWLSGVLFLAFTGLGEVQHATPWTLPSYLYWYGHEPTIEAWGIVAGLLALAVTATPLVLWLLPKPEPLHGAARWATRHEARKAGLFGDHGIVIGAWGRQLLRHGGASMISPHVLLAAPTGSGKTQGVMLPNALTWPGSLVALDIKGELYAASAGFRAEHGQAVYRLHFTPRDYQSHQYNPFAFAARDPNFLVADVQRITSYLIQLGTGDDFWPQEARRLFIALALYCYAQNEIPTLPRIRELALVGDDGTGLQRWLKTLTSDPTAKAKLHREAMMSLVNFAVSAENTVAGIVQTLVAGLSPFLSELTGAVVSGNSAPLDRLREVPTSIYLVVQPADIEQLAPIIRLFFQQVVDLNTDREWGQSPTHRHLVLLGMDEFATIGRVPAIQHSIAFMRSYGLRLLAIVQSPAQLQAVYQSDGAKSFVDNFGCGVHFTPGAEDLTAAQTLEKLLGYRTIQGRSKTRRRSASFHTGEGSETTSDQKRALMLYQDILRMPTDQLIILMSALHPIRAQKLLAMRDPRFAPRILPAPPVPTITLASAHTLLHGNTTATAAPTTPSTPQPDDTLPVVYQLDDFELELAELPATPAAATPEEIERLCHSILDRVLTPTPTRGT